jgi:hypothetical protein
MRMHGDHLKLVPPRTLEPGAVLIREWNGIKY